MRPSAVLPSELPSEGSSRLVMALGSYNFAGASFPLFPGESMTKGSDGAALAKSEWSPDSSGAAGPLRLVENLCVADGSSPVATVVPALKPRAIYCDDNLLRLHDLEAESVD